MPLLNPFTSVETDSMTVEKKQNYKTNNCPVGVANQGEFHLLAAKVLAS